MKPKLHVITKTHRAVIERPDLYAYEHEQRRKIMSRDWSKVHVAGDLRDALELQDRPRRWWRA